MSDRSPRQTDNNPADLDFSGLLPGDDQPRRRRGRRSASPRSSGRTEQQTPGEQVGEEESSSETHSFETTSHEIPGPEESHEAERGQNADASEEPAESPEDSKPSEQEPERAVGEEGRRDEPSPDTVTQSSADRAEPSSAEESGSVSGSGAETHTSYELADGTYAPERGDLARAGAYAGVERQPTVGSEEEEARKAAYRTQAALVEGRDLDLILQRVSSLTPQERGAYKSTLVLSEEHYELLADMCKEFRRRGFKGRDATLSNVVSIGLEVMRRTLDAEKNLPKG